MVVGGVGGGFTVYFGRMLLFLFFLGRLFIYFKYLSLYILEIKWKKRLRNKIFLVCCNGYFRFYLVI